MATNRGRAVDLAFIGTGVLLLVLVVHHFGVRPAPPPQDGYILGDRLAEGILPMENRSGRTLLLVIHTDCSYCTQSVPSFRAIAAKRRTVNTGVRVFVLARQDPAVVEDYLRRHELSVDGVIQVSREKIRNAGFPTTIAVDPHGRVTGVWRGYVSARVEESIIAHVFGG